MDKIANLYGESVSLHHTYGSREWKALCKQNYDGVARVEKWFKLNIYKLSAYFLQAN